MMLSLLGIVWFRPLHCYYIQCALLYYPADCLHPLDPFLYLSPNLINFFINHYVSGCIWFDLNMRTSSFWRQLVLILQHIFILLNVMFELSYAGLLCKWEQSDMELLIVFRSKDWFCGLVTIVPTCKQIDEFDIFCLQCVTPAETNNVLFLF